MSEDIRFINSKLENLYGKDVVRDLPRFRVVWAPDQFEKRLGTYRDFTPSGLFLREVTEVREVRKYPAQRDKWVLEKFYDNTNYEIKAQYSYEPLWVFEDAGGNAVRPELRAVLLLLHWYHNPKPFVSAQTLEEEELKKFDEEVKYFEDYFHDMSPDLAHAFSTGEAVSVQGLRDLKGDSDEKRSVDLPKAD